MKNTNTKTCSIENCENGGQLRRGWCRSHYTRWWRHGTPLGGRPSYATPAQALDSRSTWVSGCLVWQGSVSSSGYGQISIDGGPKLTHRVAWELANGPIPAGMHIDHTCWTKLCINTKHLRLATNQQNTQSRSGPNPGSASGVRNVHRHRDGWQVRLKKDRVAYSFGNFKSLSEAALAAAAARNQLFGGFAGKG